MISEISPGLTPLSSARLTWCPISTVWSRAIRAARVMTLRSRGARPGRFHTSPRRVPCVYLSSAGETVRISSRVSEGVGAFDIEVPFLNGFLAVNGFLDLCCISRTLDLHLGDSSFDSLEVLRSQFNTGSADILLQAVQLGGSRYRDNPGFLCQQPGESNLSTGCMLAVGNVTQQLC